MDKTKKVFALILLLIVAATFTVGCGDKATKKKSAEAEKKQKPKTEQTENTEAKAMLLDIPNSITDEKEQFKMLGDVIEEEKEPTSYIQWDDAELQKAMETASIVITLRNNVDYRTYDEERYNLYLSKSALEWAEQQKARQDFINKIRKDKYVSELVLCI